MSRSKTNPTIFQRAGNENLPPLADRIRPTTLDDFIGHEDLVGPGHLLRKALETGNLFSMLFWGPPGSGKTTLAKLLARQSPAAFHELSAVAAGVKDVRAVLEAGRSNLELGRQTILFIDEIHRFNKAQQDALLHEVEDGTIILIGATTENPSFEVIGPLLSRCRILRLPPYTNDQLGTMLVRALEQDVILSQKQISIPENVQQLLLESAGGDARKMFNTLDIAIGQHGKQQEITLALDEVREALQQRGLLYDRAGDYHYDTISAFIKSVRGSDPDAAVYWLAVMLEGGEQPEFIARRLVILASEDIGNADPQGLPLATSAMQAVHMVGMPEAGLILSQVTTYLAAAPKSNAAYKAIREASRVVKDKGFQTVPLHLRNPATGLMAAMDYGRDYVYPHDKDEHFTEADYFPEEFSPEAFYRPTSQGHEKFIRQRLEKLWPDRY